MSNKNTLLSVLAAVNFILVILIVHRSLQSSKVDEISTLSTAITETGIQQQSKINSNAVPRIAYVFAGSIRSFVCPKVHWSIRSHLIDSLGGQPSVFIRTSIEDNWNSKTGEGSQWSPAYKKNEVNEALKILNPVKIDYFSFANQTTDMKMNYPGRLHTMYRENDQRRYSMFYHRCMAYKMVQKYEKQNNMRFDWIVLARLDAAWLEPLCPITMYNSDRVWLTETGFDLFNDQFMLIPRQFSDFIYDLDSKVWLLSFYISQSLFHQNFRYKKMSIVWADRTSKNGSATAQN